MTVFAVNDTVLLFALNVPLFVQSPETDKTLFPFIVSDAPLEILMFRHTAPAMLMNGWLGVPGGMTTSVVGAGTTPPHQLEGANQSLLIPSQVLLTQGSASGKAELSGNSALVKSFKLVVDGEFVSTLYLLIVGVGTDNVG